MEEMKTKEMEEWKKKKKGNSPGEMEAHKEIKLGWKAEEEDSKNAE